MHLLFRALCLLALATLGLRAGSSMAEPGVPELVVQGSVTTVSGVVYFQPGDLLVGNPDLSGRPGLRPLEPDQLAMLPADLGAYEELSAGCVQPPPPRSRAAAPSAPTPASAEPAPVSAGPEDQVLARGDLGGDGVVERVRVVRSSELSAPSVQVLRGDQLVARGSLPMPAQACRGLVAEAEADADPVLVLVWTSGGPDLTTVGVTVFALP